MMEKLLENINPPYYTATLNERQEDIKDKYQIAPCDVMITLAMRQNGFLGLSSSRDRKGEKKTISYWRNIEAIERWIDDGEDNISHRSGVSLTEACRIKILLVENNIAISETNQAFGETNSYVSSKISKPSGYFS